MTADMLPYAILFVAIPALGLVAIAGTLAMIDWLFPDGKDRR